MSENNIEESRNRQPVGNASAMDEKREDSLTRRVSTTASVTAHTYQNK